MFLTVKEAIDISGMSQTTIHRLCQKFEGTRYVQKENNKYLIDKDFLIEKYPSEIGNLSPADLVNPQSGENLLKSLIEKNQTITSLTIENNELNQKISDQSNEIQNLQIELQNAKNEAAEFYSRLSETAAHNTIAEVVLTASRAPKAVVAEDPKAVIRYQLIGITLSVMAVIAFIFGMYYLTK